MDAMDETSPPNPAEGADHPANLGESSERLREKALDCWYLTGATASGKTKVSVELAQLLDAEIISLDSMAIYRGMDIGTAKPNAEIRSIVPHHLLDIVDPNDSFSVSQYRQRALETIDEIRSRGKEVVFVGGTALYLKALLRGLFPGPPADWEFRKKIEAELEGVESKHLYERLQMVDPVAAHKLHANDRRRIVRALEVYRTTGKPISHWQMEFDQVTQPTDCKVFTLRHQRPLLHERIERRVDSMFDSGLVAEVEDLLNEWGELGHTAGQAVGYQEVVQHLAGEMDLPETIEKVRIRTRRFARHQETWFRGMQECRIIDLEREYNELEVAQRLIDLAQSEGPLA